MVEIPREARQGVGNGSLRKAANTLRNFDPAGANVAGTRECGARLNTKRKSIPKSQPFWTTAKMRDPKAERSAPTDRPSDTGDVCRLIYGPGRLTDFASERSRQASESGGNFALQRLAARIILPFLSRVRVYGQFSVSKREREALFGKLISEQMPHGH